MPGRRENGVREEAGLAPLGIRLQDTARTFGVAWGTIFRAPGFSLTLLLGLGGILLALVFWVVQDDTLSRAWVLWVASSLLTVLILLSWGTIFRGPRAWTWLVVGFLIFLVLLAVPVVFLPAMVSVPFQVDILPLVGLPWVLLGLLGQLIFLTMGATYLFATPEELASAAVEGRSARFILGYISSQIELLCRQFLEEANRANRLLPSKSTQLRAPSDPPSGALARRWHDLREHWRKWRAWWKAIQIEMAVRDLMRLLENKRTRFLRLNALKAAASHELGISSRRLCDHMFQFSPLMFEKGALRYLADWRLIDCALRTGRYPHHRTDLESLKEDILRITKNCRRRIDEQMRLRRMRDVHEDMVRFAASLSTSASLMEYALTLAKLARDRTGLLRPWRRRAHRFERIEERLEFIHRKQRAHPGYDLHSLLTELCRQERKRHRGLASFQRIDNQARLLEAIEPPRGNGWLERLGNLAETRRTLATLPLTILRHEAWASQRVAKRFVDRCRGARNRRGLTFLVTTGYSRTVLAAIADALESEPRTRAFLLTEGEGEQLSSRLMKSEIRLKRSGPAALPRVAAGPAAMLVGLLDPRDHVTMVLGAEVFDSDTRAAHPRIREEDLNAFVGAVRKRNVTVELMILATRYKAIQGRMADSRFYTDNFDGVCILGWPLLSTIITESS